MVVQLGQPVLWLGKLKIPTFGKVIVKGGLCGLQAVKAVSPVMGKVVLKGYLPTKLVSKPPGKIIIKGGVPWTVTPARPVQGKVIIRGAVYGAKTFLPPQGKILILSAESTYKTGPWGAASLTTTAAWTNKTLATSTWNAKGLSTSTWRKVK